LFLISHFALVFNFLFKFAAFSTEGGKHRLLRMMHPSIEL
jgi:hypothetical protein